jgi:hypothetical protein
MKIKRSKGRREEGLITLAMSEQAWPDSRWWRQAPCHPALLQRWHTHLTSDITLAEENVAMKEATKGT